MPEWALLGVIWACGITCRRPDAAIFFLNQIGMAQVLCTTIAPFLTYAFMEALGKSLGQTISQRFRHDRVEVVVLCPVRLAQFLQANPAGYRERANMIP